MILFKKELEEIKNSQYDKKIISKIFKKAKKNIRRSQEEALYIFNSVLANELRITPYDNLVVGIVEENVPATTKEAGWIGHEYYKDLNYFHYNNLKNLMNGDYSAFLFAIVTIGHEMAHIRQCTSSDKDEVTPFKLIDFCEKLFLQHDYDKYLQVHGTVFIEQLANHSGITELQKYMAKYLDKDMTVEEINHFFILNSKKAYHEDEIIAKIKYYLTILEGMNNYEYLNFLYKYKLDDFFALIVGKIYHPSHYDSSRRVTRFKYTIPQSEVC